MQFIEQEEQDFGLFEDDLEDVGGVIKTPISRPKNSKPKDRGNPYRQKRKEKREKRYE